MAHRSNPRRNSAATESNASKSKPVTPSRHQDLTQPSKPSFMLKHFPSLNLDKKLRTSHKQPQTNHPLLDTRSQAKAMTTSAIVDYSSKFSLLKPNTHNPRLAPKLEKESTRPSRRTSKEKPQKSSSTELERRKLQGLMKNEKKDSSYEGLNNRSMVVEKHDDVMKRHSVSLAPSGVGRRSLCGSQVDIGDVFAINGAKLVSADMPPFMQIHAVDCARKALDSMEKFTSKTLAFGLKKEFDGVYGPAWHCIVGTSFGSFVTHSVGGFIYFSMDKKLHILLFKTAVQKAAD